MEHSGKKQRTKSWAVEHLEAIISIYTKKHDSIEHRLLDYIEFGKQVIGFENGFISEIDGQNYSVLQSSTINNKLKVGDSFRTCDTLCQEVVDKNETISYHRLKDTVLYGLAGRKFLDTQAVIGTPIYYNDKVIGTLTFCSTSEKTLDDNFTYAVKLVKLLGQQISEYLRVIKVRRTLKKSNILLKQQRNELKELAYASAHDLQEPLNTILGFVSLIKQEYAKKFDKKLTEYIDFIHQATKRMKLKVDGMLAHAKIGMGESPKLIDMNNVLADVRARMQDKINTANAKIHLQKMPVLVGYAPELHLLFEHLIENAIKFRQENRQLCITINVKELGAKYYEFSVEDNGRGINPKFSEEVFQLFFRGHQDEGYEGIGIGLAHCKKIVELHRGKIWLQTVENQGTKVYFMIRNRKHGE